MTAAAVHGDLAGGGVRMRVLREQSLRDIGWQQVAELDWSSFGIVLGAGGMTGGAFEAGVLLALQWDHGIRPHDADVLVGTSAGSVGGTLLSLGFDAADIAAMLLGAPHHLAPRDDELVFPFGVTLPAIVLRRLFRTPTPAVCMQSALHLARGRMRLVLLDWLRCGEVDPREFVSAFERVQWADHPRLKICVTDVGDGGRVVLDADHPGRLIDAVAASCSVPTVMAPVECGGRTFVDGGLWSPTNADVVAGPDGPRTVVILSPMSGTNSATAIGRISARFAAWRLADELRRFDPAQTVLVIEPTGALSAAVIDDALHGDAVGPVVLGAFTGPSACVGTPDHGGAAASVSSASVASADPASAARGSPGRTRTAAASASAAGCGVTT